LDRDVLEQFYSLTIKAAEVDDAGEVVSEPNETTQVKDIGILYLLI